MTPVGRANRSCAGGATPVAAGGDRGTGTAGTTGHVTSRRARTRQLLLDAALHVFAECGFGRSTVGAVCARAGFTRGAFYSNFGSLDELFLAMWEQRSERMLARIRETVLARPSGRGADHTRNLTRATERLLAAVPVDDTWFRINAEFSAHALRNPHLVPELAAREKAILDTIMPLVETELARIGRRLTADPTTVGRALVAVHDGTATQCLVEPDKAAPVRLRRDLFVRVLQSYTEPRPAESRPDAGLSDTAETRPGHAAEEE